MAFENDTSVLMMQQAQQIDETAGHSPTALKKKSILSSSPQAEPLKEPADFYPVYEPSQDFDEIQNDLPVLKLHIPLGIRPSDILQCFAAVAKHFHFTVIESELQYATAVFKQNQQFSLGGMLQ